MESLQISNTDFVYTLDTHCPYCHPIKCVKALKKQRLVLMIYFIIQIFQKATALCHTIWQKKEKSGSAKQPSNGSSVLKPAG